MVYGKSIVLFPESPNFREKGCQVATVHSPCILQALILAACQLLKLDEVVRSSFISYRINIIWCIYLHEWLIFINIYVSEYTSHMDFTYLSFADFQYMVSGPNWIDHLPVRVGVNIKTY